MRICHTDIVTWHTKKMEIHLKKILKYTLGEILTVSEINAKYYVRHLI